jgi:hypothetical protein
MPRPIAGKVKKKVFDVNVPYPASPNVDNRVRDWTATYSPPPDR